MPDLPPSPKRIGRPARISRAAIVEAAATVIATDGFEKLTMRRLAQEVGSTPMALYHHVRDRDALLVLLLDEIAAQIPRPSLPSEPLRRIEVAATAIHDTLVGVPWVVEVLTADDLLGRAALWFVEQIIDGAIACGATPERAVYVYRSIWYYTAGELIIRAAATRRRAESPARTRRERIFADLDPGELPRLAGLGPDWTRLTTEDTYREGLVALIDGLLPQARH
ncbi:TetR/AcrR family transcriptional regulator [Cryptosporangium sp. NPDC048952]|uniref:TetR/AcrR family transcriptional regulator n=1 Tax=Cryptosporangium sp. NPDC048952 TaxID=3363961 RepID=UPI00371D73A3